MNFHQIFIEIATSTFSMEDCTSVVSDFSNLVQRDCIGRATCMPIHFLFSLKNGVVGPYLFFDPHDNTVLAYISKMVQDKGNNY